MAAQDYVAVAQQLYVSYFGRPADYYGLQNFTARLDALNAPKTFPELAAAVQGPGNAGLKDLVNLFATSQESINLYGSGTSVAEISKFVAAIYTNVLNRQPDLEGLNYWVNAITKNGLSKANAAAAITEGALNNTTEQGLLDAQAVKNKVAVATDFTDSLDTAAKINAFSGDAAAAVARDLLVDVDANTVPADFHTNVTTSIDSILNVGQTVTLTNGTDNLSGTTFNAGLVYTPSGSDRINSLQSEDVLTGKLTGADANNTLNATLGNSNDNGLTSITPTLKNIQTINLDITGNTNTLDVRFADSLKTLSINKLTLEAGNSVVLDNIGQPAANLTVKNSAAVNGNVKFNYVDGVLGAKNAPGTAAGGETGNVFVENTALALLHVGNAANTEGFETINLNAKGLNNIKELEAVDAETVKITGSGNLNLLNNTASTAVLTPGLEGQYTVVNAGGITIGDGVGIRSIDATAFTGNLNINVSTALGGRSDPGNSGTKFHTDIKLGSGNDVIWTTSNVAATSATLFDTIDGGAGTDTLRTFSAGVNKGTKVTNVEALELRGGGSTAWISSFDAALASVLVRNEIGAAQTFNLRAVTKALAENGNIVLKHAVGAAGSLGGDTLNIALADASGASDTVVVTVQNDLNNGTQYNYTINAQSEVRAVGGATGAQLLANRIENVTINDNDTETNVVTLSQAAEHTGTVKLTGGVAGQGYTVDSTLLAAIVDASTQKSNLTLRVGIANQDIRLGSGDDLLTFDGLDTFNGSDKLSDAGGTDTVRAAFSKDVTGTPDLAGIEKLQIVATGNTALDLAKGQGITELAILSAQAVDQAGEIFTAAVPGVDTTDVITLKNTKLTAVNFFGDEDATNAVTPTTVATTQTFNGLTLENNTGDTVAVNIGAPLKNLTNLAGNGITAYNLGQLTTHGVKNLSIVVGNEITAGATTTIANIWDRDLVSLSLQATGNVNVGTVTGNTVNSNLKTFDASKVGGDVTAIVKALGDSAIVTLANGNNVFNALGSAGNNVAINAGNGKNNITGTAQSDYITTGSGNDIIDANRGNNTVKSGAGNDTITALNGSNTIDVGSGWADVVNLNYDSAGQQNLATNVIAGSGTSAFINIVNGGVNNALGGGDDVTTTFGFAVGDGAELSVKFTGVDFDPVASTLNGRSAIVAAGNTFTGVEANLSNLLVVSGANNLTTVTGGAAADVFIDLRTGVVADAIDVSTGAGNDAIVFSQVDTGAHNINAGTGADRIILSAAVGVDTLTITEGDSTAAGRDIITNFHNGEDIIDVSGTVTAGTVATLTSTTLGAFNVAVGGDGVLTTTAGVIGTSTGPSVNAVLDYLAANAKVSGDVFQFAYDSNGDGVITAADNLIVFTNLTNDIVVELVGHAAAPLAVLVDIK